LHSMPGVFLDFALHARSLLFMNIFCSMPGVLMILRNIQIYTAVTKLSPKNILTFQDFCLLCYVQQKWRMSMNYWHDNYQWQYKKYSVKKLNFYYVNLQIGESLVMAVEIWIFRKQFTFELHARS
jgi:hypothetical protein